MNSGNFLDVYFGEIVALAKDVAKAQGIITKVKYTFMPPGWHHLGQHETAKIVRENYFEEKQIKGQGLKTKVA